ncbi:hypothetical protein RJT34_04574 [Clitoria ternatea]|uniref:Uncharacterized protein n=1 Tax=Clitoria ternatea TaxID=43366 RepID=A0AAN9KMX5_CLITE
MDRDFAEEGDRANWVNGNMSIYGSLLGCAKVDYVGFSGGIWRLWNPDSVLVKVIEIQEQVTHLSLAYKGLPCCPSVVYVSSSENHRTILWMILLSLCSLLHLRGVRQGMLMLIILATTGEGATPNDRVM